jgi:hypothetical protein
MGERQRERDRQKWERCKRKEEALISELTDFDWVR